MEYGNSGIVSIGMVGVSALGWLYTSMNHRKITNDYFDRAFPRSTKVTPSGNFPLRSFTDGTQYDNFNQTTEPEMESRENAVIDFVKSIERLDTEGDLPAYFAVDSNVQSAQSRQAGKTKDGRPIKKSDDVWWAKRYTLTSLFPDEQQRWLPVSFVLAGTERSTSTQHLFHGAVKKLVIESDVELLSGVDLENVAVKLIFTLVDTNWQNLCEGKPREFNYVCTQENSRAVTSAVLGPEGVALPIYVSTFAFRLESEPVDFATDVWSRFRIQGLGFNSNTIQNNEGDAGSVRGKADSSAVLSGSDSIAVVHMHMNKGAQLTFLLRAIPSMYSADIKTDWNRKSGATFIQSISMNRPSRDALPLVLVVQDEVYSLSMVRLTTLMELRNPGDLEWDANIVNTIAFKTVDNQHEFLLDPVTGLWTDRHPTTLVLAPTPVNTPIDLVLLSDIPLRSVAFKRDEMPGHGKEEFTDFKTRGNPVSVNLGVNHYLRQHALNPELAVSTIRAAPEQNWWKWYPTENWFWAAIAGIVITLFIGLMVSMRSVFMAGNLLALCIFGLAILFVVLTVYFRLNKTHTSFVLYGDQILYSGTAAVFAVVSIYYLLSSRLVGAPPISTFIALGFLAQAGLVAYTLSINGRETALTREMTNVFSIQASLAALACLVIVVDLKENIQSAWYPMPPKVIVNPLSVFLVSTIGLVIVSVPMAMALSNAWQTETERNDFAFDRAMDALEDKAGMTKTEDEEKLDLFYRREVDELNQADRSYYSRNVALAVCGLIAVLWVFVPAFSMLAARFPVKQIGPEAEQQYPFLTRNVHRWVFFGQLVAALALLANAAFITVHEAGILTRGAQSGYICETARANLFYYDQVYLDSVQFDAPKKREIILNDFAALQCVPDTLFAVGVALAVFTLLGLFALAVERRRARSEINILRSLIFVLFIGEIIYSVAWLSDEERRIKLLTATDTMFPSGGPFK
jgi:hypothetical protein